MGSVGGICAQGLGCASVMPANCVECREHVLLELSRNRIKQTGRNDTPSHWIWTGVCLCLQWSRFMSTSPPPRFGKAS